MKAILIALTMVLAASAQADILCKSAKNTELKIIKSANSMYVEMKTTAAEDIIFSLEDEELGPQTTIEKGRLYSVLTTEDDAFNLFGTEIEVKGDKNLLVSLVKMDNESLFPIQGLVGKESVKKTLSKEEMTCDQDVRNLLMK